MTRRSIANLLLAASSCSLPAFCAAQGYSPVVTVPAEQSEFAGAYGSPAFSDSTGYATMQAGGYAPAACPPQGMPANCPPADSSPWKKCALFTSPKFLEPPRGTYARLEYLLWEIEKPGSVGLGAPTIEDPTTPLVEFAPASDNTTSDGFPIDTGGFGYTPNIDELQLRDNSGLRLTVGVPLKNYATFEASFFALEQGSDHFEWGQRDFGTGLIVFDPVTSVKQDGVTGSETALTSLYRIYDSMEVDYESDMWGADARFVIDSLSPPGEGFKLRPLFGFKYVGLQEAMHQKGQFDGTGTPFATTIDSDTDNTILGGTIGLRSELVHRWFVLGIEPAVTFAGNIAQSKVVTERFLSATDPRTERNSDYFDFSPILDLKTYARIRLSENMSVHVGYDAFWLARVYRPARAIEYNVATDATQPSGFRTDFDTKREDDHVAVEGLSVGVEFVF